MKKIFIGLFMLLAVGVITSCEEVVPIPSYVEGASVVATNQAGIFDLLDLGGSMVTFDVDKFGPDNIPVSEIVIMKSLNGADPIEHARISTIPSSVSVSPAQAVAGTGVNVNDLALGDVFSITMLAVTPNGTFRAKQSLSIPTTCSSDLGGTYSVTTTYGYHDFLPDFSTHTMTVTVVDEGDGNYFIEDLSGGLYSVGPYVANYGTTGVPGTIQDVCNNISWTGIADDWGPFVPNPGKTNSVDPVTGVITLNWLAEAYGENGESIYTPQ
jgi:hypothetical protein